MSASPAVGFNGRPEDHFVGHHYAPHRAEGPVSFLNPTKRTYSLASPAAKTSAAPLGAQERQGSEAEQPSEAGRKGKSAEHPGVYRVWRSRDNRKGRHAVAVVPGHIEPKLGEPELRVTETLTEGWRGVWKMMVRYPVWDISYDVAVIFTLGSIVWVINGFFAWLPLQVPSSEFPGETSSGGGISALVGATIFEIGSVLLMLEAVNENRTDCFGWALEEAWESGSLVSRPARAPCSHHHSRRRAFLKTPESPGGNSAGEDEGEKGDVEGGGGEGVVVEPARGREERDPRMDRRWLWWPTWYELRTHYFREIGFLACLSQMVGATVFWISGFVALPAIVDSLSTPAENGVYWLPQVVGGTGFIISSFLFMIEVQEKWYIPAPRMLGWHIGLWNLIGAIGFTLCGALGFAIEKPGLEYALTLCTFIGSWAFLIGSGIQWYESLDKYPVSVAKKLPADSRAA